MQQCVYLCTYAHSYAYTCVGDTCRDHVIFSMYMCGQVWFLCMWTVKGAFVATALTQGSGDQSCRPCKSHYYRALLCVKPVCWRLYHQCLFGSTVKMSQFCLCFFWQISNLFGSFNYVQRINILFTGCCDVFNISQEKRTAEFYWFCPTFFGYLHWEEGFCVHLSLIKNLMFLVFIGNRSQFSYVD